MKRYFVFFVALTVFAFAGKAVLDERNLAGTLSVLRSELATAYDEQQTQMAVFDQLNKKQRKNLVEIMQRSHQISLMLYSQKQDFSFDLAFACQQATEQYRTIGDRITPYGQVRGYITNEVQRFDGLIHSLESLPPRLTKGAASTKNANAAKGFTAPRASSPFMLSKQEQLDREACLRYARAIRYNYKKLEKQIDRDQGHYDRVCSRVKELNDYAMDLYSSLQQSIFLNGDENYITLLSQAGLTLSQARDDFKGKYSTISGGRKVSSDWRGPIVLLVSLFTLFYIAFSALLCFGIFKWIYPRLHQKIRKKLDHLDKTVLMMVSGMVIFAVTVMLVSIGVTHNFVIMASQLLINFAWVITSILLSILIRLRGKKSSSTVRVYAPFLLMAFVVIIFRIVLIPNNVVNLIYPILMLIITGWQFGALKKNLKNLQDSDRIYGYVSFLAIAASCVMSWLGYTLFAVQVMMWWTVQLATIQTITCFYDLLKTYYDKKLLPKIIRQQNKAEGLDEHAEPSAEQIARVTMQAKQGDLIGSTWFFDLVSRALVPVLCVMSVLWSIYIAAAVFEMTALCKNIFMYNFINEENVIRLSLSKIALVLMLFYVFNYINYLARSIFHKVRRFRLRGNPHANMSFTLGDNIIAILVWGIYFIFCLVLLQIPKSGISIVTAGLATGIGFAMKDLLNNFFYGISLMTGRVRVGDIIECNGIQGKVESITYQSTQVITLDGSVIAFLNSTLFTMNFKNLTRNHNYVLVTVPFGVSYGTNVDEVRKHIVEAIKALGRKDAAGREILDPNNSVSVVFTKFGDSSVDLLLCAWVLVPERIGFASRAKEVIYNTLNAHNIEIPFPQCDVHMKQS